MPLGTGDTLASDKVALPLTTPCTNREPGDREAETRSSHPAPPHGGGAREAQNRPLGLQHPCPDSQESSRLRNCTLTRAVSAETPDHLWPGTGEAQSVHSDRLPSHPHSDCRSPLSRRALATATWQERSPSSHVGATSTPWQNAPALHGVLGSDASTGHHAALSALGTNASSTGPCF